MNRKHEKLSLQQAKAEMQTRRLALGEQWCYCSKDGGRTGILIDDNNPEAHGYTIRDVLYVWEGRRHS